MFLIVIHPYNVSFYFRFTIPQYNEAKKNDIKKTKYRLNHYFFTPKKKTIHSNKHTKITKNNQIEKKIHKDK